MLVVESGQPFNVTIGLDLNGDNQFNDRPAFATAASTNVVQTRYGAFDLSPSADAARIPFNYGTGPSQFSTNLRMSKTFGIGRELKAVRLPQVSAVREALEDHPQVVARAEVDLREADSARAD
jgi:hypothetical protein